TPPEPAGAPLGAPHRADARRDRRDLWIHLLRGDQRHRRAAVLRPPGDRTHLRRRSRGLRRLGGPRRDLGERGAGPPAGAALAAAPRAEADGPADRLAVAAARRTPAHQHAVSAGAPAARLWRGPASAEVLRGAGPHVTRSTS